MKRFATIGDTGLQYCDSSLEEASSCVGENVTRNLAFDCLC